MAEPPPTGRARASAEERRGAAAHYEDPVYYEQTYRRRREDVAFYAALAAGARGPVLELGCGTGRVTRAMARAGAEVVAVDRMASMLRYARDRAEREPAAARERVRFVRGDLRSVRLGRRFALVVAPFNVLMHLYTRRDIERCLATVRAHLTPRGRLVFDVLLPDPATLGRDPSRVYKGGRVRVDGVPHLYGERFSYDAARQVEHVDLIFERADGDRPAPPRVTPLAMRQLFPAELEALLHYNGLRIVRHEGGFEGEPLDRWSDSQVVFARLRADHSRSSTSQ